MSNYLRTLFKEFEQQKDSSRGQGIAAPLKASLIFFHLLGCWGLSPCLTHAEQALYHRATFSVPLFIEGFSACWQAHLGLSAKLFLQESSELSWECCNSQLWANERHQGVLFGGITLPQNHYIQAWVEVGPLAWPKQDTIERTSSPHVHYRVVKRGETVISSPFPQSISWASFSNMLGWEEGQATVQSSILISKPAWGPPGFSQKMQGEETFRWFWFLKEKHI